MSKKNKNRQEEKKRPELTPVVETPVVTQPEVPSERVWSLHDAARQMIKGYKEAWWPSIHKMAHTLAVKDNAPESQCRSLFVRWGAELK